MGSSADGVRQAASSLQQAVERLRREYGDTLGVRRLVSDVQRFTADLDELGDPLPGHRPGLDPEELVEIPDEEYDASMWSDAEQEGFGAPGRHIP